MNAEQTFILLKEMRRFYKECSKDKQKNFSEKEFEAFVNSCEKDFYQWLKDNFKFFSLENKAKIINTTD